VVLMSVISGVPSRLRKLWARWLLPCLSAWLLLGTAGTGLAQDRRLTVGIISPRNLDECTVCYAAMTDYLAGLLGRRGRLEVAPRYQDGVRAVEEGRWDIAFMSPLAYIQIKNPDYQLLASVATGSTDTYSSIVYVSRKSSSRTFRDLKGARIAFVSKSSASGFLYPVARMLEEGFNPFVEAKEVVFPNAGDLMALHLARWPEASYDAAAGYGDVLDEMKVADAMRVIYKEDGIPFGTVLGRKALFADRPAIARFRVALWDTAKSHPEVFRCKAHPSVIYFDRFVHVQDQHYDQMRAKARVVAKAMGGAVE